MPEHAMQLTFRPRDGPRKRLTFKRDRTVGDWEYGYWLIEEVYETDDGQGYWRETGREHVTEPELCLEREGRIEADREVPGDA
ncbi:hypothetical protein [Halobellus rubicundus]|uniref:Uncharacterized protein n=1 Tax=Halobellus rubicundus TaxID=2996466 RepID=A0ABD5MHL0_9EURY